MWKKETTIARLELLGAAISARLSTTVLKEFPTDNVYFWTDSTTVLAWLKIEEPWGVFVYNRVQEIRKLTSVKARMVGRSQLVASFALRMAY
ncbi:integrase_H2C2 domain-containing protein [Trichonephila clavipes]|nr:integrase_H2C2 domain-containing protein [Trichonephila clavipes]